MKSFISTVICPLALVVLIVVAGLYEPATPIPAKPCCPNRDRQCIQKPSVIAITATWCGPCQRAKPELARIEAAGFKVTYIDIDKQPEMAAKYHVNSVPTFLIHGEREVETQDIQVVLAALGIR